MAPMMRVPEVPTPEITFNNHVTGDKPGEKLPAPPEGAWLTLTCGSLLVSAATSLFFHMLFPF